jgi:flagellar basal body-associated protein FliL
LKKEISQPLAIIITIIVVILVGVFGWLQLRSSAPNVKPEETKAAQKTQMGMMKDAMMKMRQQQGR